MFLDKVFSIGLKEIHNGFLLDGVIYGRTEKNFHYPTVNIPLTFYETREEALEASRQIVAWIPHVKPQKLITKKEADASLSKKAKQEK